MLLKSLHLRDFLSFGRDCMPVELGQLNVIIGAKGSGKSNFIESIDLMRSAPSTSERSDTRAAVRDGGGVREWIWIGAEDVPEPASTPHSTIPAGRRICAT